jgi:hypothetical protein
MTRIQLGAVLGALAMSASLPVAAQDASEAPDSPAASEASDAPDSPGAPSPAAEASRPAPSVRATADQLFREGRLLLDEGQYKQACEKFKASHALDPAGGALLNLAACYERDGKTASAWRAYNEALAWANADRRDDRSAYAVEHIRELEPQLARLVLTLPGRVRMKDIVVVVDGETLDAINGVRIPVDPGRHNLEIQAPGRESFQVEFTALTGDEVSVSVPPLREAKDRSATDNAGTMSLGGEKDESSSGNTSGGPTPINERPGACGCRAAGFNSDFDQSAGVASAVGGLFGLLVFRRRRPRRR